MLFTKESERFTGVVVQCQILQMQEWQVSSEWKEGDWRLTVTVQMTVLSRCERGVLRTWWHQHWPTCCYQQQQLAAMCMMQQPCWLERRETHVAVGESAAISNSSLHHVSNIEHVTNSQTVINATIISQNKFIEQKIPSPVQISCNKWRTCNENIVYPKTTNNLNNNNTCLVTILRTIHDMYILI